MPWSGIPSQLHAVDRTLTSIEDHGPIASQSELEIANGLFTKLHNEADNIVAALNQSWALIQQKNAEADERLSQANERLEEAEIERDVAIE